MIMKMADGNGYRPDGDEPGENKGVDGQNDAGNNDAGEEEIVEAYANEYANLDNTIGEINSWMDKMEDQSDNLSAELDELLESSKQARREIEQSKEAETEMETKRSDEQQS